nr:zinc ABC transporter ATP-binding protein AztA [Amycolatopsis marina]
MTPTAVTLSDISAGYGQREVLSGISARVPLGQVSVVVGANGAGKSSLLNVVAGVLRPTKGTVTTTGSCRPAYVVQRSHVSDALPVTVRSVVAMGRWAHRGPWRRLRGHDWDVVDNCMERLGIGALARRQLGALSGGQRQRVLVAQGLAQEADVLMLDEPAAGMDLDARARIDDALTVAARGGVTVLRVTHDLEVARKADHCLLLRAGRLIGQGAPGETLTERAVREAWGVPELG